MHSIPKGFDIFFFLKKDFFSSTFGKKFVEITAFVEKIATIMLNGVRRNKKCHISKPFTPPSCDAKSLVFVFFFLFHIFHLAHCAISHTINPIPSIQQICRIYTITQIIHGYCHYGTNGKIIITTEIHMLCCRRQQSYHTIKNKTPRKITGLDIRLERFSTLLYTEIRLSMNGIRVCFGMCFQFYWATATCV